MTPLRRTVGLVASFVLLGGLPSALASDRMPVRDLKPLLRLAIETGSARGVLVGEAASYLRDKFDAPAPIEIEVRSVRELPDPGCQRLEVSTHQAGVFEGGKREDKSLTYQLNFCLDGRMPGR